MARPPKYTLHKPSGQARVRIDGKDHYLGPFNSAESRQRYDELIARYLTSSRNPDSVNVTLNRLCILFLEHCEQYYRKNGEPTSEMSVIRVALREVVAECGRLAVSQLTPLKLMAIRERMIASGWKRKSINQQIRRIVRMLKWGVANELVPFDVYSKCSTVQGLAKGRSEAVESKPVKPVPAADIDAVKPHVRPVVWAMVQLQLLTGMRPGEVRTLKVCEIDISADVWVYTPPVHKTEHHARDRRIHFGPQAQTILRDWMTADRERYVFESTAGSCYTKDTYNRAITRACGARKGNVPTWNPNQLRHNNATALRKKYGIEAARTVLGHSDAGVTEIYAEQDFEKARQIMAEIG